MTTDIIGPGLLWYAVFVISSTFHEAAHALAASKLGDPTSRDAGLLTLDPLAHIRRSPVGMVIIPIASFVWAGWMMGWASVPYDPRWAHDNRRKAALMALAGPAANLGLIALAVIAIRGGVLAGVFAAPDKATFDHMTVATSSGAGRSLAVLVSILLSLNLILLIFNLLPLPPLDGSQVLSLFLSDASARRFQQTMAQPPVQLIGLIVAWRLLAFTLPPTRVLVLNVLYPGSTYGV
ncbi:MAG: site-2 protease family protein [Planctomycetota bacterium]|jgi:Zn-dependent protease